VLADPYTPKQGTTILDSPDIITDVSFSLDRSQFLYERARSDASCGDLWIANKDGTDQRMLIDCVATNQFIAGAQWVYVE